MGDVSAPSDPECFEERDPARPSTLLVRNGKPAVDLGLRSRLVVLADDLAVDTNHYDLHDVEVMIREMLGAGHETGDRSPSSRKGSDQEPSSR